MKQTQIYAQKIAEATQIGKTTLPNSEAMKALQKESEELITAFQKNSMIKIPFVGDFNAGKSSLLNAMIGRDILPTNITPETAVSYELVYSPDEKVEHWRQDDKLKTTTLSDIKALNVKPGDIVKVYIDNTLLRDLYEKDIILVDMPGIDSGIEAHNNAILNYLSEGTHYMVFSDVEQGTLRNTAVKFMQELKQYGISSSVFLSKIDKKDKAEVAKVLDDVKNVVSRYFGSDIAVGMTSASYRDYRDVIDELNKLDVNTLIKKKYRIQVSEYIERIISQLQLEISLISQDSRNFENKINEIKKQKERAIAALRAKNTGAQPLDGSAQDILNDIRNALVSNSREIASKIYSNSDSSSIQASIIQVIRPVLVNSFKRELTEYQDSISVCLMDFSSKAEAIINDSNNQMLQGANEIIGNFVGKDLLESVVKKGLDKLMVKLAGYKGISTLLSGLSKLLGPIITIIVNILPDILRMILGKSKDSKISELAQKFSGEVANKICEAMRPEVITMLSQQRAESDNAVEEIIADEAKRFDVTIRETLEKQSKEKENLEKRVSILKEAYDRLQVLKADI